MLTQPTVFVVEEDDEVRYSVAEVAPGLGVVVQQFSSADETLAFCRPEMPGCFVLEDRAGGTSGLILRRQLKAQGCQQPFIFVSSRGDVASAVEAMHQGALDCIEKPLDRQRLSDRVRQAISQDANGRRQRADRSAAAARFDALTPRERQVVELVAAGKITKEIAKLLSISSKTVEVHRSNIMRKMHVESAAELLHLIARFSLLPLAD
ncbi:MAG TPA: LuxR C-terminal-related transcriptional regulator [Pirellulales bacterium]|jgi:FixJ family two-component response regulator|nr:LuxR C-terminal-related transcriptional regulator [Pirellulales bacterium]